MVHVDHFPLEHFGPVAENQDTPKKAATTRKKKADASEPEAV